MKIEERIDKYLVEEMVYISKIINDVKSHKGKIIAYAAGFGMFPGVGEMPVKKNVMLKKLNYLKGPNSLLEFSKSNNTIRIGFALSFLNKENFDKFFK